MKETTGKDSALKNEEASKSTAREKEPQDEQNPNAPAAEETSPQSHSASPRTNAADDAEKSDEEPLHPAGVLPLRMFLAIFWVVP